jgi:hypothetical protein
VGLTPELDELAARVASEATPVVAATMHELQEEPAIGGLTRGLANAAFQANALAAALDAWGLRLSPEQERRVGEIFEPYAKLAEATHADPVAGVWNTEDLLALTRARLAVQKELEATLDERQRAALWPPALKDRVGLDFFSAATLWRQRILVAEVPEGEDVAEHYTPHVQHSLRLAEASADVAEDACRAWLKTLPPAVLSPGVRGALSRGGFVRLDELLPFVEAWPALLRDIEARAAALGGQFPRPPAERTVVLIARTTR